MAALRLTEIHKNILCKAYSRKDKRVLGGSPTAKSTLTAFGYLKHLGISNGYDIYELTPLGSVTAKPIFDVRQTADKVSKERAKIRIKAALYDDMMAALTNPDIGAKTFELPDGWKVKLDRSGPSKVIVQVTRQEPKQVQ